MTEFWKSNERHFCTICKCWMDAKPRQIRIHEEGAGHKENYIAQQKATRDAKASASKKEATDSAEWAKIEAAANASYQQDLAVKGIRPAAGATPAPVAYVAPPAKPLAISAKPAHASKSHAKSAAPKEKKEKVSPWQATLDPATGATYYYNIQTLETSWTKPVEAESKGKKRAAGEDDEDDEDSGNKKAKTEDATPAAPVEIDEDTGLGKWATVEAPPEPSAEEAAAVAAAASKPRMTPFGLVKPDAPAAAAVASGGGGAPAGRWGAFAADDADDADEDGGAVDMAQQLRRQFGTSSIVHLKPGGTYEPGASLLDDDNAAANAAAAAPVVFKKKAARGNQRQPVAPTNH